MARVQLKTSVKPKPTRAPRYKIMNVKVSDDEYEQILAKAHRWAGGSVSAWVRHMALYGEPKPSDLVEVDDDPRQWEPGDHVPPALRTP